MSSSFGQGFNVQVLPGVTGRSHSSRLHFSDVVRLKAISEWLLKMRWLGLLLWFGVSLCWGGWETCPNWSCSPSGTDDWYDIVEYTTSSSQASKDCVAETGWGYCAVGNVGSPCDTSQIPELVGAPGWYYGGSGYGGCSTVGGLKFFIFASTCPPGDVAQSNGLCVPDPESQKSLGAPLPGHCTSYKGDPCNAGTGNEYQSEEDYRGVDGGLSYVRSYNSLTYQWLGLGFDWISPFHKRLEISGTTVQVRRPDGRGEPFSCPTGGSCQGDSDTQILLTIDSNGYTLTRRDNATERYDLNGRIVSEMNVAGNVTSYTYGTNGKLAAVTDPFGRQLGFNWNAVNGTLTSITDPAGYAISYFYDSKYNLIQVNYPDNTAKLYYYEDTNHPNNLTGTAYATVSNGTLGNITRFSTIHYDPTTGNTALTEHAITDNTYNQEKFTFAYGSPAAGETTVTDAVGAYQVMAFQSNLGVNNLVTSQLYSAQGVAQDGALQQTFDGNNNRTCRQDETGRVTTNVYNTSNQLQTKTEGLTGGCGAPQTTSATRTTSYQYLTVSGQLTDLPTQITQNPSVAGSAYNKIITIQYADTNHPNLPTAITVNGYTPSGTPVSRRIGLAYYDSGYVSGALYTLTDPDGNTTTFNYNNCNTGGGCGQLSSVTNALGQVTTYDNYDLNARLLQQTDSSGVITVYRYDPRGRVTMIIQTPPASSPATSGSMTPLLGSTSSGPGHGGRASAHRRNPRSGSAQVATQMTAAASPSCPAGSACWQYSYTPWGDIASVTDPDGVILTYQYDAAHYLRFIVDGAGNYIHYSYDLKGNRTQDYTYGSTGNLAHAVSYSYDLRNHLASISAAGNVTQLVYDAVGNLITQDQASDGVNRTYQHQYDALNRLFKTIDPVNGANAPTLYGYDVNDHPTGITAPNNLTTSYQYDDLGNLLTEVSPDRGTINYQYDAAGNVLSETDARGQVTNFNYDALNRLIDKQSSANFTRYYNFIYDSCYVGRLCSVNDGAMPVMGFGYDGLGRINYSADIFSGLASQYTYSLGGRLSSITDPSGRSISYTYDFQNAGTPITGHITQVSTSYNGTTTVLAGNPGTISYYPFGPVSGFSFGNGLAFQAQYDSAYRPTSRNDGPLAESITTYDGADNILARTIPQTQNFTYDALNRLSTATDNSPNAFGSLGYLYDPNGNRQSETRSGSATTYSYTTGTNWLTQVGTDTRQFNPDGSTATTTSLGTLTYDGYGDLTAVGNIAYSYDPFGRRHGKNVGGTMTAFAYGAQGELLYEVSGNTTKSYVYLNGIPLARIDNNSQIYYYHDDHLGAPLAMTNSTGTTVWAAAYEPFGSATITTGIITNNLRLPGQYFDQETGLYYNGRRYYDPKIGRYISSDPIGLSGGLNTYLYARANPLRYIDPSGLWYVDINFTGGSGTVGGTGGVQIGPSGLNVYGGGGVGTGAGASVTINSGDPSPPGWSANVTASGGTGTIGGQVTGSIDTNGNVSGSVGGGWGVGWGTAVTATYTYPIWQPNKPKPCP